jgi:hypothetical protein
MQDGNQYFSAPGASMYPARQRDFPKDIRFPRDLRQEAGKKYRKREALRQAVLYRTAVHMALKQEDEQAISSTISL